MPPAFDSKSSQTKNSFLLDVQHYTDRQENRMVGSLAMPRGKALNGITLPVVDKWSATPKLF